MSIPNNFTYLNIALSNASYRSLSISSYIMVKNSVPIFVLLFSFLFGLESITFQLIFILLTILGGVAFSVSDQVSYEGRDLFLVLLASVFSGLRWTLTQLLLSFQSSSSTHPSLICIETLYKLAPWSSLFLTLTSLLVETYPTFTVSPFLFGFLILSGCLSFAMVLCEYIVVHFTSVLAFSIAGIAKESIILLASMLIFGDRMTLMNIIGLLISLLGILWFNLYRARSTTPGEESHEFKLVPVDSIEENIDSLE
ncbi:Triose-phosphate Transporter [Coelomomyces lativittatus]|nr:Triose-phosphate Transporter [Coelomomyces lativittatus]